VGNIFVSLIFMFITGCSVVFPYDKNKVSVININEEAIEGKIIVEEFQYIPPSGLRQRSVSIPGNLTNIFTNHHFEIDTRVSEVVKLEIDRIFSERLLKLGSSNSKCILSGEIHYLAHNSSSGDTLTNIKYIVSNGSGELFKTKINYKWNHPIFHVSNSFSQGLANSIHGNVGELLDNSGFRSVFKKNCVEERVAGKID